MEMPLSVAIASAGDRPDASRGQQAKSCFGFRGAFYAYKFLFQHFWRVVRLLFLPIGVASVTLYVTLNVYLAQLLHFLDTPNPRSASLALGTLAAGLFFSLLCYAMAVVAISDLVLGKPRRHAWLHFKAGRQEWRVYAAYLRLLLLLSVLSFVVYVLSIYVAPLLMISGPLLSWILMFVSAVSVTWLFARVGFLVAPVIAAGEGPVLRRRC